MSIINENNQNEITNFLVSIDAIARTNPSILDEITTDEVLKELIAKADRRMIGFLRLYNENVSRAETLSISGGPLSEQELCKETIKVLSRDLLASYSLYTTYKKVAESRNLETQISSDIAAVEKVLVETGLLERTKQI